MGDSRKYSFTLRKNREHADLYIEDGLLDILEFLSEIDDTQEDLGDVEYIESRYLSDDNLEQIESLWESIQKISPPEKRNFQIFFSENSFRMKYIFPCITAQIQAFANDEPVVLPGEIDFYESSDDDESESSEDETPEPDVFYETLKTEEVEKRENYAQNFILPMELQKPKISSAEFEKLIGFIPIRKNEITFDKKTEDNTDRNFRTQDKLVLRANYTQYFYEIMHHGDKGTISKITITDFQRN